jgi:hypothetical protein
MDDPFVNKNHKAYVFAFGKVKKCSVDITDEGLWTLQIDPYHIFGERNSVLYVERGEELYGSPHYEGRSAVRLTRKDFLEGEDILNVKNNYCPIVEVTEE